MNAVQNEVERMVLRLISRRPVDWTYESALAAVKGFAALIAAHERKAEREACIRDVCAANIHIFDAMRIAEAIRARGET